MLWRSRHKWQTIGKFRNRLGRYTFQYECTRCGTVTDGNGKALAGMPACPRTHRIIPWVQETLLLEFGIATKDIARKREDDVALISVAQSNLPTERIKSVGGGAAGSEATAGEPGKRDAVPVRGTSRERRAQLVPRARARLKGRGRGAKPSPLKASRMPSEKRGVHGRAACLGGTS